MASFFYFCKWQKKDKGYYKILTHKDSTKLSSRKIKIGELYSLDINSLLYPIRSYLRPGHITGMNFSDIEIDIEPDSILDLHNSKNIKGLYYLSN